MMKAVILGSGASVPSLERNLPSLAVQIGGDIVLFDCGEGTQRQMMKFGLSYSKVQAIFISHLHLDHLLGVFGLSETLRLNGRTDPLHVFAPAGASRIFTAFRKYGIISAHEFDSAVLSSGKPLFAINEHDIFAFEVNHGPNLASYGFRVQQKQRRRFYEAKAKKAGIRGPMFTKIQEEGKLTLNGKTIRLEDITYVQPGTSLVYSGDTIYCKSLVHASKNADLLVHDSTFDDSLRAMADEKYHSTASDAARAAKEAGAKHLLLTHISNRYADTKILLLQAKKIFKKCEVAYDGYSITLK